MLVCEPNQRRWGLMPVLASTTACFQMHAQPHWTEAIHREKGCWFCSYPGHQFLAAFDHQTVTNQLAVHERQCRILKHGLSLLSDEEVGKPDRDGNHCTLQEDELHEEGVTASCRSSIHALWQRNSSPSGVCRALPTMSRFVTLLIHAPRKVHA